MQGPRSQELSVRSARELLGVAADAGPQQLGRAYRREARRLHPDVSLEPDATERFWALQAAYRLALDAARARARHDAPTAAAGATAATGTPIHVEHRDPTVVLRTPATRGAMAPTGGVHRHVAWLLAGPVQVQPPRSTTGTVPPSPRGHS